MSSPRTRTAVRTFDRCAPHMCVHSIDAVRTCAYAGLFDTRTPFGCGFPQLRDEALRRSHVDQLRESLTSRQFSYDASRFAVRVL